MDGLSPDAYTAGTRRVAVVATVELVETVDPLMPCETARVSLTRRVPI